MIKIKIPFSPESLERIRKNITLQNKLCSKQCEYHTSAQFCSLSFTFINNLMEPTRICKAIKTNKLNSEHIQHILLWQTQRIVSEGLECSNYCNFISINGNRCTLFNIGLFGNNIRCDYCINFNKGGYM